MKAPLLLALSLVASAGLIAQGSNVTTYMINTDGTTAQYYVTPQGGGTPTLTDLGEEANVQTVAYDNAYVYVETQGLAEIMGPCTNPGNPTGQDHIWKIPINPTENTGTKTEAPNIASIGVLINGVAVYALSDARSYSQSSGTSTANGDGIWNGHAYYTEGETLDDKYGGHPQQEGEYHSHAVPSDLYEDAGTTVHSPLVGWAWDGFPIYGPYAYSDPQDPNGSIVRMSSGYELRDITERKTLPDGTTLNANQYGPNVNNEWPLGVFIEDYEYTAVGTLDEYNGRFCKTPEFPNGIYAYFVTMEADGTPAFPYYIGLEYYGNVEEDNFGISGGKDPIPASATVYDPLAVANLSENSQLRVYPNPSRGMISIEQISQAFDQIAVINLSGRVIFTAPVQEGLNQGIDLSHLAAGTYIIRLSGAHHVENKSLVIQ